MQPKENLLLFKTESSNVYDRDFIDALQKGGVKNSDVIYVHSDITTFGKLALFDRNSLCSGLVNALRYAVGSHGTIIMPTFTYSFCKGEIYDLYNSPSTVGTLTEFFRKQPEIVRTVHPIFSAAIEGYNKEKFQDIDMDSFGDTSIFGKLHKAKGKLVFLGATIQSCTYVHHIEQMHGVPYRFMKTFNGTIKKGNTEYSAQATYLVRYLDRNVILDLSRLEQHLSKNNLMSKVKIGDGYILVIDADVLFNEGYKLLDKDVFYFLKEKPHGI